VYMRGDEIKCI